MMSRFDSRKHSKPLCPCARRRAMTLGRNPDCWMSASTCARVFALTLGCSLSTREMVATLTPATRATSCTVFKTFSANLQFYRKKSLAFPHGNGYNFAKVDIRPSGGAVMSWFVRVGGLLALSLLAVLQAATLNVRDYGAKGD